MDNQQPANTPTETETPPVVEKQIEDKISEKSAKTPYKKVEFNTFLDLLRGEAVHHWAQIARTLGVDKDTITDWKNHPAAQKAIRDGIEDALDGMTKAGSTDWRMWESKLKMMGVSPIEKNETDLLSGGEKIAGFNYLPPAVPEPPQSGDDTNPNDQTKL